MSREETMTAEPRELTYSFAKVWNKENNLGASPIWLPEIIS